MRKLIATHRRGSALITVIFLIAMMALLTGSMLKYTITERRGNERNRLTLRSKNMAENVSLYVSEQISNKLRKMRTVSQMKFTTTSTTNKIYLPPDNVLVSNYSAASDVETYAGITSSTGLQLITDATNANYGLQVLTGTAPVIAKSKMSHPALGSITTYAEQDLQISEVPLFQFAIFYNKDLEVSPGADMVIAGPVHSNGDFIARCQTGFSNTVQFKDRVSAVGGFFANTGYKGTIYNEYDTADTGPGGSGPLYFQNPSGTVTNVYGSSTWRDHKYGGSSVTTTSVANFKTFATNTYSGNLRTSAHQVSTLALPGVDDTANNSGRSTIEAPDSSDSAELILAGTQVSRKAGLYVVTNPTAETRTGKLPDATTVSMRPYSYRCWLNTVNTDGSHTLREVILPGQPSYGASNAYVNNLPNAYRVDTSVGANQVLRIPQGTANTNVDLGDTGYAIGTPSLASFQDAYFYDMRRASNSTGHPFSRSSANFTPRPIAKIDFDMTRLKMTVNRTYSGATTATVFNPAKPNSTIWSNSIYNASASAAAFGLGLATGSNTAFSIFPTQGPVYSIQKSRTGAFFPSSITVNGYYQTGSAGTVTSYSGYFKIETSTDGGSSWTAAYTSGSNESSYTYTIPTGITHVRISQYVAGSTSNLLDQQIIPIVDETATTTSASLSNDRGIVPCSSSSSGFLYSDQVITDMRVFVGGIDDTANWTFSASSATSGLTGSFGTAGSQFANRYTVTAVSNSYTTGTVTLTASRSGYSNISKTFTVTKQTSLTGGVGSSPAQTGYWMSIGNGQAPDPFKMYFAPSDPNDTAIKTNPGSFAVSSTDLYNAGSGPWYDGVTVYIHSVDAEVLTESGGVRDRMDSGVRLWNGRGPAASLTTAGCTGFTFCTNDAVYIVGHFNADGSINSNSNDTAAYGGYSARYPDSSSEYLASVMGDALTIYSQPTFTSSGGSYYQSSGWSDSLSANRCRSTNWSSSWQSSNPGSGNAVDGTNTSITPAYLPNLGNIGTAGGGSAVSVKFDPAVTEVSTCLLAGIVETNSHQHSGGVHNFPRLNEDWAGTGLYIRGSMVAMFASEIATEPWSIRIYSGAGRYWGLNIGLTSTSHDVPLEPMLISASRLAYRELTSSEYSTMKTTIQALP